MDDRGANIDIVFRNGLKDFEVLPPPEVWDAINPVIIRKQKTFVFLRAAALVVIMLSMGFFAYMWSRQYSDLSDNPVLASNEESFTTVRDASIDDPVSISTADRIPAKDITGVTAGDVTAADSNELLNDRSSAPELTLLKESGNLSMNIPDTRSGLSLTSVKSVRKDSFINTPDQQYFPGENAFEIKDRWSIAAMASPTYYARFMSGNDEFSKQMMASEQPIVSYSGGLALSYKLNKRLSLQTGLYYSSLGQDLDGISSFGGFQQYDYTKGDRNFEVLTTSGTVFTNNADVFLISNGSGNKVITNYTNDVFDPEKASLQYINNTMRQTFSYLELPIVLRYKLVDKTFDLNLIGGVSYNLLVNNSVYTMNDGGKYLIGKTEGLNPISFSSSLGMGMEYSFSENLSLNLEPMFRYYLNPFTEVAGSKFHPYSFGIFSGVSYKF